MRLVSWNVNGLRAVHKKGLTDFIQQHTPDILCLQETKAHEDQLSAEQRSPGGLRGLHSPAQKKGYSSVATFFGPGVVLSEDEVRRGFGQDIFDLEGRFLISHHEHFDLYNIYFPSGTTGDERQAFKYRFLDYVFDYLTALPAEKRARAVICGDFNICHREIDIHHPRQAEKLELSGFLPDERRWMDRFVSLGFVDAFRHVKGDQSGRYTWWSYRANARQKNLGWRIDYFFIARELSAHVKSAEIFEAVPGSDHCPISIELDF